MAEGRRTPSSGYNLHSAHPLLKESPSSNCGSSCRIRWSLSFISRRPVMVELYFIVMSVSAGVLAGALSVILYLDRPPRSGHNGVGQSCFPTTLRNQTIKRGTDAVLGQPGILSASPPNWRTDYANLNVDDDSLHTSWVTYRSPSAVGMIHDCLPPCLAPWVARCSLPSITTSFPAVIRLDSIDGAA